MLVTSNWQVSFEITAEMGFLNGYNKDLGAPTFERFYVGGMVYLVVDLMVENWFL